MGIMQALVGGSGVGFTPVTRTYATAGSYTDTIPSGATHALIEIWGATGGGSGGTGTGCGALQGQGAGSGGYTRYQPAMTVANNGQTINVVIASAGAAGIGGGNGGAASGACSVSSGTFTVGATLTCNAGAPGLTTHAAAAGGSASGGSANTTGNASTAGSRAGAAGVTGINGTGPSGGAGSVSPGSSNPGLIGADGKVIIKYT